MTITALPTPPSTADPDNFDFRADSFLGALPTFATEMNAEAALINGYTTAAAASQTAAATSATAAATSETAAAASAASALMAPGTHATTASISLNVEAGSLSFTLAQTGKEFVVGQWITITDEAAPQTWWMLGPITAFTAGTGAITVEVVYFLGSTHTATWVVAASAPVTVPVATGSFLYCYDAFGIF
jgi:hypothetical protein